MHFGVLVAEVESLGGIEGGRKGGRKGGQEGLLTVCM